MFLQPALNELQEKSWLVKPWLNVDIIDWTQSTNKDDLDDSLNLQKQHCKNKTHVKGNIPFSSLIIKNLFILQRIPIQTAQQLFWLKWEMKAL